MKRGHIYPQIITRWVMGKDTGTTGIPPVWSFPRFSAIFFYYDEIGTPLFEEVTQENCELLRYSYSLPTHAAYWGGEWSTANGLGSFFFGQRSVNGDQDVAFEVGLTFADFYWTGYDNKLHPTSGIWSAAVGQNFNAEFNEYTDFPWVNFTFNQIDWVSYSDLYTDGKNTQETRPAKWNT